MIRVRLLRASLSPHAEQEGKKEQAGSHAHNVFLTAGILSPAFLTVAIMQ